MHVDSQENDNGEFERPFIISGSKLRSLVRRSSQLTTRRRRKVAHFIFPQNGDANSLDVQSLLMRFVRLRQEAKSRTKAKHDGWRLLQTAG